MKTIASIPKHRLPQTLLLLLAAMLWTACENPNFGNPEKATEEVIKGATARFLIDALERMPLEGEEAEGTVSGDTIDQVCTRVDYAFYSPEGSMVKAFHREKAKNRLNELAVDLPEGTYRMVAIAHSGQGAPTLSAADKIKFKDNKVTETFLTCQDFSLEKDATYALKLRDAVSLIRLKVTNAMPAGVRQMKFYYTGGSSTLDATTGLGCVQSRQTEFRTVTEVAAEHATTYDIYTFPHASTDEIKLIAWAIDASGTALYEKAFERIPVSINRMTVIETPFFTTPETAGDDPGGGLTFVLDTKPATPVADRSY